jgi:hypothetical protein
VSFGTNISKFTLDGKTETPIAQIITSIKSLLEIGGRLYMADASGAGWFIVDPNLGTSLGAKNFSYSQGGLSVAPTVKKIFGRTTGVSPSDIVGITLNADGSFGAQADSPHHGDYPNATRTFVMPGETRVIDDAGLIYTTANLSYAGSLAGAFNDIDFAGDQSIVLRGNNTLVAYSATFTETGRKAIAAAQLRIYVSGGTVHSFARETGRGVVAARTELSTLQPVPPPPAVDPTNLTYTPDAVELGDGGVIYLLSKVHKSIFCWSLAQAKYLPSIPLLTAPEHMAYSGALGRLYLAYPGGRISAVNLTGARVETDFANLPQTALGLQTAGEYLFACDPSGAWATHYTFSPTGALISSVDWNYFSRGYTWSAVNRRVYFLRDDTSPNDLHWESIDLEGKIAQEGESPYHGDYVVRHPIRVSPDGASVVLGNGDVYNALTLQRIGALPVTPAPSTYSGSPAISDTAWLSGKLFTTSVTYPAGSSTPNAGKIQRWSDTRQQTASVILPGVPVRLVSTANALIAVSIQSGKPRFDLFSSELTPGQIDPPPDNDRDGIADASDPDDDNDGIPDLAEDLNQNGNNADDDSDADAIANSFDPDDDNDGVLTRAEDRNQNGSWDDDDDDADGLPDYLDADPIITAPTRTLAFSKGGDVPGAGTTPRIPADSVWRNFGIPAINNSGRIAFVASSSSSEGSVSRIYMHSLLDEQTRDVAETKQPAPGAGDGVLFASFKDPLLNERGDVAFLANLSGAGVTAVNNQALFVNSTDNDSDRMVAREGAQPAGVPVGARWKSFISVAFARESNAGGAWTLAFTANMVTGSAGAAGPGGVTRLDDSGLWLADALQTRLALREGQALAVAGVSKTVKSFHALKPLASAAPQGHGATPSGVPVQVVFHDNTEALLRVSLPATDSESVAIETLALTGDTIPGVTGAPIARLGIPVQNSLGDVTAWITGLSSRLNAQAIVSANASGDLNLVARKGAALSSVPGALTFSGFSSVVVNHEEQFALLGKVSGAGASLANDAVLARRAPGPAWQIIAREGSQPPGTPAGARWASFTGYGFGDDVATLAFIGKLHVPKAGEENAASVTTANDFGLWFAPPGEPATLLLREGDALEGKTVRSFTVLSPASGSPMQRRGFSSDGRDLIIRVIATDSSQHLVHIRLPATTAGPAAP